MEMKMKTLLSKLNSFIIRKCNMSSLYNSNKISFIYTDVGFKGYEEKSFPIKVKCFFVYASDHIHYICKNNFLYFAC